MSILNHQRETQISSRNKAKWCKKKRENRACNGCTWTTPTRTRIARLQALDYVASPNSTKSSFSSSVLISHTLLLKKNLPWLFFFQTPLSCCQLHYSWFSENVTTLNYHHGGLVILATHPMPAWLLQKPSPTPNEMLSSSSRVVRKYP